MIIARGRTTRGLIAGGVDRLRRSIPLRFLGVNIYKEVFFILVVPDGLEAFGDLWRGRVLSRSQYDVHSMQKVNASLNILMEAQSPPLSGVLVVVLRDVMCVG